MWDGLRGQLALIHSQGGEEGKKKKEKCEPGHESRAPLCSFLTQLNTFHPLETPGYPSTLWAYLRVSASQMSKVRDGVISP